jgi:hypothetical protein
MFFFPLQQIICNACRMILRFFLDIVNGQEAQQIIIKLTAFKNVFDAFTTFNALKFSIFLDSLLSTKNTIVSVYLWQGFRTALQIICWSGKKNIVLIITLQLKMSRNMILKSKNS